MTLSKALVSCQPVSCIAAGQGPTAAQQQPVCGQTLVGAKLSKLQNCFAPSGQRALTVAVVFLPFPSAGDACRPKSLLGVLPSVTRREICRVGSALGCLCSWSVQGRMRPFQTVLVLAIMSVPVGFLGYCLATAHLCVLGQRVSAAGLPRVRAVGRGLLHPHTRFPFSVKL